MTWSILSKDIGRASGTYSQEEDQASKLDDKEDPLPGGMEKSPKTINVSGDGMKERREQYGNYRGNKHEGYREKRSIQKDGVKQVVENIKPKSKTSPKRKTIKGRRESDEKDMLQCK
jgi:hypothetical protein